jgi:hypothetical protein
MGNKYTHRRSDLAVREPHLGRRASPAKEFAVIRVLAAAALLSLAACGPAQPPAEPTPHPDAAAQLGEPEQLSATLPPASQNLRFVGNWATTADQCANPPWRFRADGVSTQGEVSCAFNDISDIPGGYQIDAACHAEGVQTQEQIQLTFAESAQAMMVAGGPWGDAIGLVHCAP